MQTNLTINQVEVSVQSGLTALRNAPLNDCIQFALEYLVPKGYRPVIQLEEDGRKKRSTASAESWSPDTGEIVISFERETSDQRSSPPLITPSPHLPSQSVSSQTPYVEVSKAVEEQIDECCRALAEAEKAGRNFIALKWFRDDFLCTRNEPWVQTPQLRQDILTAAIESGKILTSKLSNPKAPQFPTTTIRLNPSVSIPGLTPRFRPVPVRGEPGSVTLLRDRGIS